MTGSISVKSLYRQPISTKIVFQDIGTIDTNNIKSSILQRYPSH